MAESTDISLSLPEDTILKDDPNNDATADNHSDPIVEESADKTSFCSVTSLLKSLDMQSSKTLDLLLDDSSNDSDIEELR